MDAIKPGWNLCQNAQDYDDYKQLYCAAKRWVVEDAEWGQDPREYPCMVATYSPAFMKVTSAHFYMAEARELLGLEAPLSPVLINTVGATQNETNKHVAAHLLTLLQHLVRSGQMSQETYEQRLTVNLAVVDGYHSAQRDNVLKAVDQASVVLLKVLPEETK